MPKFVDQKPPSREPARPPRPEPHAEPPGLDVFVARAAVTPPPELTPRAGKGRVLPSSPMPVRFPPDVKAALEFLADSDQRSQQQILERVAFPAILEAARRLSVNTNP